MPDKKKSFLLYLDTLEILHKLTDEQAGKLLKAFLAYHSEQDLTLDPMLDLVFFSFQAQFERDSAKYKNIVNRNKNNGSKGGRPKNPTKAKKPSGLFGNPSKPKKADSDSDNDNDSDSDSDNEVTNILDHQDDRAKMLDDGFEYFWSSYPRKIGKKKAKQKFMNLTKKMTHDKAAEFVDLITSDSSTRFAEQEENFIQHPTTYLNSEAWNDNRI